MKEKRDKSGRSGDELSPELLALIRARGTGEYARQRPRGTPATERTLAEWRRAAAAAERQQDAQAQDHRDDDAGQEQPTPPQQGPERFIGPKSPDHPGVNRGSGGRGTA